LAAIWQLAAFITEQLLPVAVTVLWVCVSVFYKGCLYLLVEGGFPSEYGRKLLSDLLELVLCVMGLCWPCVFSSDGLAGYASLSSTLCATRSGVCSSWEQNWRRGTELFVVTVVEGNILVVFRAGEERQELQSRENKSLEFPSCLLSA